MIGAAITPVRSKPVCFNIDSQGFLRCFGSPNNAIPETVQRTADECYKKLISRL